MMCERRLKVKYYQNRLAKRCLKRAITICMYLNGGKESEELFGFKDLFKHTRL